MSDMKHRDVALGVINMGNTCYMNAVLQALAHAPELCLALDYEPHHRTCPIALENERRRLHRRSQEQGEEEQKQQQQHMQEKQSSDHQVKDENESNSKRKRSLEGTSNINHNSRKSRRSGNKSPAFVDKDNSRFDDEFCILCSLEEHLERVHVQHQQEQATSSGGDPVIPDVFVHGFVERVAPPSFRLGIQEDSHEFLRLLIEAMQKASILACSKAGGTSTVESLTTKHSADHDELYPFKLFRGTVESNVRCFSCGFRNATIDPIEDIGLEVTRTSSGSNLSDLHTAFQRFTREEPLTEYKCDQCGQMGNATKQSRLASIPPILTLHLKRFRYGASENYRGGLSSLPPRRSRGDAASHLAGSSGSAKIEGHSKFLEIFDLKPFLTEELSQNVKNMFCRLFAVIVHAGKNSHSGHYIAYVRNISKNEWWKMDDARVSRVSSQEVLNAEAYMLFYRVVDHPIAQDLRAKQQQIHQQQQQHQQQLQQDADQTSSESMLPNTPTPPPQAEELSREIPEISSTSPHLESTPIIANVTPMLPTIEEESSKILTAETSTSTNNVKLVLDPPSIIEETTEAAKEVAIEKIFSAAILGNPTKKQRSIPARKIHRPKFLNGTSWAKIQTKLSSESISLIERAEDYMASNLQLTPKFLQELQKGRNPAMTGT
jgi:ubiquitin C-terminal hydrolase